MRNNSGQPLTIVISITQNDGDVRVFGESIGLQTSRGREFALALQPGAHTIAITTSNSIQEAVGLEIPERGDTVIDVDVRRDRATVKTTSG